MTVTITSTGMENTGFLTGDGAVQEGVLDKRQVMDKLSCGYREAWLSDGAYCAS